MSNFEELKKKAAEIAGTIADKSLIFAKKAADKTKSAARITRLNAEIAAERDRVKKNYSEIGKLYYENFKDEPAEVVAQAVSEISISMAIIESKKAEIEELKASDDNICDAEAEECYEEDCKAEEECECECESGEPCECEKTCESDEAPKEDDE